MSVERPQGAGQGSHPASGLPELVELLFAVGEGIGPGHGRSLFPRVLDASADGFVRRQPARVAPVQGLHEAVQLLPQLAKALCLFCPVVGRALACDVQGLAQLLQYLGLLRFGRMELKAEGSQVDGDKPPMDNLKRRELLRHEEHSLALGYGVRYEIRDGLALAGARRSFKDKVPARVNNADGFEL